MPITRTIEIKKKSKRKTAVKSTGGLSNFERDKRAFVESVIQAAKEGKRFPWECPNFVKLPKSLSKMDAIEDYNKAHPDKPKEMKGVGYRGANVLILCMAMGKKGFTDSRWVTMDHVTEKGGRIKDDQIYKYTKVIIHDDKAPLKKRNPETGKWEQVYKKDKRTGEYLLDKDGKKIKATYPKTFWRPLYNVQQTEGLNLAPEPPMKEFSETEKNPAMEKIMENSEAKIHFDQGGGLKRFYSPTYDEIHLPPRDMFKSMSALYATAAHEIGHSTGHESRLHREFGKTKGSNKYAREELVAELTSVFLSQELQVKIPQKEMDSHVEYIRGWDEQIKFLTEKPDELFRVIADAQNATDYIKEHMLEKDLHKDKVQDVKKEETIEKEGNEKPVKSRGIHRKSSSQTLSR